MSRKRDAWAAWCRGAERDAADPQAQAVVRLMTEGFLDGDADAPSETAVGVARLFTTRPEPAR